jgi:uncharacterized protein
VAGGILPFRQFVLKVHSRCDLACDHCYVYEHADQSWRGRPKVIADGTVALAGERIAEHARQHRLAEVSVVLHGGEPLLAGAPRLAGIARTLRAAIEPVCALDLRLHTNGVRLSAEFCDVFVAERIKVGVSLDGDQAANDRHRLFATGRSSYQQVIAAVNLLRGERYKEIYAGLLCTIDVRSDPLAVYRALAALDPPDVDFLLPHATWDAPPPGGVSSREHAPYADWLAVIYDAWAADGKPVPIRVFDSIAATALGGASRTEALGLAASDLAVIETDGEIEQADSVKVAYDGAPATGLNIARHPLDDAAAHPAIQARQRGLAGLSRVCRQCPVVTSCGGGLYAHRYKTGSGFDNPSVYCADLLKIITHVQDGLRPAGGAGARPGSMHQLSGDQFDSLAAGYGDIAAVEQLATSQRSLQRKLLQLLRDCADADRDGAFSDGWGLAAQVQRKDPAAWAYVLSHPFVRAWAESCLRAAYGQAAAGSGPAGGAVQLPAEAAYLAAVAAAAAVRASLPAEIEVPVADGYLYLPTLGRLRVGPDLSATVTVADGGFEVRADSGKWHVQVAATAGDTDWEPVRELRAGDRTVSLEDTDLYRDCLDWPAAPRVSGQRAADWQDQFAVAWPLIERSFPGYLPALASGLSAITPLANDDPSREISAASRQAFGAVGAALPAAAPDLALLLLHEFQHVKLGAVLDLFDLCDPSDRRLYYAPWREDPRPLEQLLQGTYAHIAVTDFWRTRRHQLSGADALAAGEQFARWRQMTAEAIDTLADSGTLTPDGERFVEGMRGTVWPWLDEPVEQAAVNAARGWAAARRAAFARRQEAAAR